jgi:tetratricopeptide (TPR) repeat protein
MIISQGIIADIYFIKQNYNEAEKYYLNIFNICKKYLCLGDKQYIHWICSLTELYRQKFNDNDQYAIRFCEQQLELHRRHLSEKHLSVAYLLMKLGHIKQDIIYYQQALQILIDHDHWEYATIAQCHQFIGDYYLKNEQTSQNIEKALKHYYEIRKIYIKIYPENHQRIIEIEDFIQFNESRSLNE